MEEINDGLLKLFVEDDEHKEFITDILGRELNTGSFEELSKDLEELLSKRAPLKLKDSIDNSIFKKTVKGIKKNLDTKYNSYLKEQEKGEFDISDGKAEQNGFSNKENKKIRDYLFSSSDIQKAMTDKLKENGKSVIKYTDEELKRSKRKNYFDNESMTIELIELYAELYNLNLLSKIESQRSIYFGNNDVRENQDNLRENIEKAFLEEVYNAKFKEGKSFNDINEKSLAMSDIISKTNSIYENYKEELTEKITENIDANTSLEENNKLDDESIKEENMDNKEVNEQEKINSEDVKITNEMLNNYINNTDIKQRVLNSFRGSNFGIDSLHSYIYQDVSFEDFMKSEYNINMDEEKAHEMIDKVSKMLVKKMQQENLIGFNAEKNHSYYIKKKKIDEVEKNEVANDENKEVEKVEEENIQAVDQQIAEENTQVVDEQIAEENTQAVDEQVTEEVKPEEVEDISDVDFEANTEEILEEKDLPTQLNDVINSLDNLERNIVQILEVYSKENQIELVGNTINDKIHYLYNNLSDEKKDEFANTINPQLTKLKALKEENEKIFIQFLTKGYESLKAEREIINNKKEKLEELRKDTEKAKEIEEERNEVSSNLEKIEEKINNNNAEIEKLEVEISKIETRILKIDEKIKEVEEKCIKEGINPEESPEIASLKEEKAGLISDKNSLVAKKDEYQSINTSLEGERDTIENNLLGLESEILKIAGKYGLNAENIALELEALEKEKVAEIEQLVNDYNSQKESFLDVSNDVRNELYKKGIKIDIEGRSDIPFDDLELDIDEQVNEKDETNNQPEINSQSAQQLDEDEPIVGSTENIDKNNKNEKNSEKQANTQSQPAQQSQETKVSSQTSQNSQKVNAAPQSSQNSQVVNEEEVSTNLPSTKINSERQLGDNINNIIGYGNIWDRMQSSKEYNSLMQDFENIANNKSRLSRVQKKQLKDAFRIGAQKAKLDIENIDQKTLDAIEDIVGRENFDVIRDEIYHNSGFLSDISNGFSGLSEEAKDTINNCASICYSKIKNGEISYEDLELVNKGLFQPLRFATAERKCGKTVGNKIIDFFKNRRDDKKIGSLSDSLSLISKFTQDYEYNAKQQNDNIGSIEEIEVNERQINKVKSFRESLSEQVENDEKMFNLIAEQEPIENVGKEKGRSR